MDGLIDDRDAPAASSFEHLSTGRAAMIALTCIKVVADRLDVSPKEAFDDLIRQAGLDG